MTNESPIPDQSSEGMIFGIRGRHLAPLGDNEIAPFAEEMLPLVREALQPLCNAGAGWANQNPELVSKASRLQRILGGEGDAIAAAAPVLWFLSVELGLRIQADDRAVADPKGMTEPLPPEARTALELLMHILPAFVRAFPKARALDTARTTFFPEAQETVTARSLAQAAVRGDVIAFNTAELIELGFALGEADLPLAEKGKRASMWSVRNLAIAGMAALAGAFGSEMLGGVVDATGLRPRVAEFVRRNGEDIMASFASAPADLKLAIEQNVAFYRGSDSGVIPPTPMPPPLERNAVGTLVVDQRGAGDFRTIGEAIKAAAAGSRIVVRPGRYAENLRVRKPLEIVGDGPREEIVVAPASGTALRLDAETARI
ncbi:MAG: hypothetical protein ACFBRM_07035 [Pikeienuella sp.]